MTKTKTLTDATGSHKLPLDPLTMEGVKARLSVFHVYNQENRSQGRTGRLIDSALAAARHDVEEARILLAIRKLDCNADHSTDPVYQSKLALNKELEAHRATRKLGTIFDGLTNAENEFRMVEGPAKAAEMSLLETGAHATALKTKMAGFVARNAPIPRGKRIQLENELRGTVEILTLGSWKKAGLDTRPDVLAGELEMLKNHGNYEGQCNEAGAAARINEIEQQLDVIYEAQRNVLSEEDRAEYSEAHSQLPAIEATISKETPNVGKMIDAARAAKERFNELIEVASIASESVIEVYQISCDLPETGLPN